MPFIVAMFSSFDRDFKSLTNDLKTATREALSEIHKDYKIGKKLSGNMSGFMNYSYNKKPELRVIYSVSHCNHEHKQELTCKLKMTHTEAEIESCEGVIDFVFVKTREQCNNLYNLKKKEFQSYKRS